MKEELEVPQEVHELFNDFRANERCRDIAIRLCVFSSRAIKYAKEALRCREKAWALIREVYPKTAKGQWEYDFNTRKVSRSKP